MKMASLSLKDIDDVKETSLKSADAIEEEPTKKTVFGPIKYYVQNGLIPGFGLFSESYLLFIFNQVSGPFKANAPWNTCYGATRDSNTKLASLAGIVAGMILFGFFADKLGRRLGSILTNSTMLLGAIFLTAASPAPFEMGDSAACEQFFWWIFASYFVFGIGVGGEYPLSASIASERTMKSRALKRGRDVLLTFSCQGVGQNVGNLVFFFLTLACTKTGICGDPDNVTFNYRVSMGISLIFLTGLLPYRLTRQESVAYKEIKRKQQRSEIQQPGYLVIFKEYGIRLVGTAGSWFLWDIIMYGNSLFSKQVTAQVNSGLSTIEITGYTWLYTAVALPGYFLAAFTVDYAWMGRKRLQAGGFILVAFLFFLIGGIMPILKEPQNTGIFVFLYCLATFFYQFGPNATTFLVPAEVFATPVRARCHGMSAMSGKLGAIVGEQGMGHMLDKLGVQNMFYVMGAVGILGAILTIVLVPDSRTMNIEEEDERFVEQWLGKEGADQFFKTKRALEGAAAPEQEMT